MGGGEGGFRSKNIFRYPSVLSYMYVHFKCAKVFYASNLIQIFLLEF